MKFAVDKITAQNPSAVVWLTERGTTFDIDLVVDMRSILAMQEIELLSYLM